MPNQCITRTYLRIICLCLLSISTPYSYAQTTPQTAPPATPPGEPAAEAASPEPAANEAEPVPAEPPSISRSERDNQLLAQATPDETQWLDTSDGKILALFRPTENRMTKGAVLLLHAAETPPGWPAPLENLRRNLPQYGWVTLAVPLPQKYNEAAPARTLTGSQDEAAESDPAIDPTAEQAAEEDPAEPAVPAPVPAPEESSAEAVPAASTTPPVDEKEEATPIIPRAELIAQHLDAALAFLREQGQLNLILLIDNSSVFETLQHLQASNNQVQALVLINLQPQEQLTRDQLAAVFSAADLPVMDVFLNPDNPQQVAERKLHRAQALRNKLEIYQQFVLPKLQTPTVEDARSFWLERVRGFMEQQALGKEVKKAETGE